MVTITALERIEEINTCEKFLMSHKLWGTDLEMTAYGQIGYLKDEALIVKLTAHEKNPLTTYKNDDEPVYRDSALEVFMYFATKPDTYLNLEINANGALLAQCGKVRAREWIATKTKERVTVTVEKSEEKWSVLLVIPLSLVRDCYGDVKLQSGTEIGFNVTKICEAQENLHFISYADLPGERPNFHQPEHFLKAWLE